jgi:L-ribulose-5-phosphate 3-epimerase UlaE
MKWFFYISFQDRLEVKKKAALKMLEVTVNELEDKLAKKSAEHQPPATNIPVSLVIPQSKQVRHAVQF